MCRQFRRQQPMTLPNANGRIDLVAQNVFQVPLFAMETAVDEISKELQWLKDKTKKDKEENKKELRTIKVLLMVNMVISVVVVVRLMTTN
uniref:Uncharacterized protein n=1 Tax=Globodera pallida TaxID=36090 RepID=A0A183BX85_GLOPA